MAAIYLIRHGQASFGAANYDRLSPTGEAQARALGTLWARQGWAVHHAFHGTLERQQRTLGLALDTAGLTPPVQELAAFDEFDHEGLIARLLPVLAREDEEVAAFMAGTVDRKARFQSVFEKIVRHWLQHPDSGVEPWSRFRERVTDGLNEVKARLGKGEKAVIVTSGGPITAAVQSVLGLGDEAAFGINWSLANAGITKLVTDGKRLSLAYLNHYHYLRDAPECRVTYR